MKRHALLTSTVLFLGIATVAGCATHKSANTFNRSEVGAKQTVHAGTVTNVREVTIQTDGTTIATATGAVVARRWPPQVARRPVRQPATRCPAAPSRAWKSPCSSTMAAPWPWSRPATPTSSASAIGSTSPPAAAPRG